MVCGWGYPQGIKGGGSHAYPPLPLFRTLPDNRFSSNSRRSINTGRNRLTWVTMRPPPHVVTPLHPFLFSEGRGGSSRPAPGGVSTQPPCCIRAGSASRGVSDGAVSSGNFRKRGRGVSDQTSPHIRQNETPPPMAYPPCPGFFYKGWGGSIENPHLGCDFKIEEKGDEPERVLR